MINPDKDGITLDDLKKSNQIIKHLLPQLKEVTS